MCDFFYTTFSLGVSFCASGYASSGCTPLPSDGVCMGIAKHVQCHVSDGKAYRVLVDPRTDVPVDSVNVIGGAFTNSTDLSYSLDVWTATPYADIGTIVARGNTVVIVMPDARRHEREKVALCPVDTSTARPVLESVFFLPAERTKTKLFTRTFIYPALPIPVGALVAAYTGSPFKYKLVLVSIFYTDFLWWISNGASAVELGGVHEDSFLIFVFALASLLLAVASTSTTLHRRPLVCVALAPLSLLSSPFYYAPVALLSSPIFLSSK